MVNDARLNVSVFRPSHRSFMVFSLFVSMICSVKCNLCVFVSPARPCCSFLTSICFLYLSFVILQQREQVYEFYFTFLYTYHFLNSELLFFEDFFLNLIICIASFLHLSYLFFSLFYRFPLLSFFSAAIWEFL